MTVKVNPAGSIELTGVCPVEDAEVLLQHLLVMKEAQVDWSECEAAHTAVIQVLMIARVKPVGAPRSVLLEEHVGAMLDGVS